MRKFIWWLLIPVVVICAFAIFIIPMMEKDAGYVLIALGGQIIEMRFWMAVVLLLVLAGLIWLVTALFKGTLKLTIATFNWWPAKAEKQLWLRQERAMAALWEGNHYEAHRNFTKIAKTKAKQNDTLALINAANSAVALELYDEADHYLNKARLLEDKTHEVTLLVSEARVLHDQNKNDQALAKANQALTLAPLHTGVLTLLKSVYLQQNNWLALETILPRLKKAKITDDLQPSLEVQVYAGLMSQAQNVQALDDIWQRIPKVNKNAAHLICSYAEQQIQLGSHEQAELWLRKSIKSDFNDALVSLYGQVAVVDSNLQLQHAEKWLAANPKNATLLLALGRIAQRCELWGKAKSYFQQSLESQASSAAYAELARLLAKLGEHQASTALFQEGLLFTAGHQKVLAPRS